ncbi:MAG: hypothetical protein ACRC8S_11525 [Fimbriiglobus sp.]
MATILQSGIVRGGQIVLDDPINLPDGSEVTIVGQSVNGTTRTLGEIEFMTEDDQSDDAEAIQRWSDQLHSLPPVPEELKREGQPTDWDEQMKLFNLEAMRKQFAEPTP